MDQIQFLTNFKPEGLGNSGLTNMGNTCYMNAAFQVCSHTLPLTRYFSTGKFMEDINPEKEEFQLCKEYIRVLMALWEDNCMVRPVSFMKTLQKFHNAYTGFRQHDSHELLTRLIDVLHLAVSYRADISYTGEPASEYDKMKIDSLKVWRDHFKEEYSFIVDLFYGQFNSSMVCKLCDHIYHSYDPFCSLSLPINKNTKNIYDCFDEFTTPEILDKDNMWRCDKCQEKSQATKKISIWKAPKILILSFKRFDYMNNKNNALVDYPIKGLNINKYVFNGNNAVYDLYGVVCHSGSANMGHYVSFTHNADGNWYYFNDESVTKMDETKLVTQNAYVLLYRRRDVDFFNV